MATMRIHCRVLVAFLLSLGAAAAQEITSPEKFFGFQLGADKKMARWDKIVEYYGVLEKAERRTDEGRQHGADVRGQSVPRWCSSLRAANMAKLERYREVNARLSDPRGLTEAQARALPTKARRSSCSR